MNRNNILISFSLLLFLLFTDPANATVITRDMVVSNARTYVNYNWTVIKTNSKYPIYSVSGKKIVGEAYSYGQKMTTGEFGTAIANGKIPRNWEGNTQPKSKYAGIDCSGLVTRCWGFNEYNVNWKN